MAQTFEIKLPLRARDEGEAAQAQKALQAIARHFTPQQLSAIAARLANPLVKAAILKQLGA
jgi:hypothetical protein